MKKHTREKTKSLIGLCWRKSGNEAGIYHSSTTIIFTSFSTAATYILELLLDDFCNLRAVLNRFEQFSARTECLTAFILNFMICPNGESRLS